MKEKFSGRSFLAMSFFVGLFFIAGLANVKAVTVYGVTTGNQLVRFESATPANTSAALAITGLQAGENILGIDFRPVNGQLYALGSTSRLYTINVLTGVATQVGSAGAFTLSGTNFGFDFNPTVDRIRVVSDTGQNLRLNPNDGTLSATDPNLNPGAPSVTAAAYTNNFAGATTTTLYDIDTTTNSLYQQNPANAGTLVLVGSLGVVASGVNGFDIASSNGAAYAALTVGGATNLYTINLATGAATLVGAIGNGATQLRGLAVQFGGAASGTGRGTALDFDGDRRADFAVYRSNVNTFFINNSANNSFRSVPFGLSDDVLTPGDYDGDGRADISVWRPSSGTFFVLNSSNNSFQSVQFGQFGDEPVARDYNGDGRTDYAVVRRTGGNMIWFVLTSDNFTYTGRQFGLESDIVAPGDYDGDGRFDLAVYRGQGSQQATFFVQRSTLGFVSVPFGLGSDLVVPGDYDGDGATDYAVVRTGSPYNWYILNSRDNSFRAVQFGTKPFYTAQADYDGDGRTDVAVFDPTYGNFIVLRSSNGAVTLTQFGANGDYPVANYDTH
jgi:hypothetical protein